MVGGSGGVVKAPGGAPEVGASLERPGMLVQAIFGLCPTPGSLLFFGVGGWGRSWGNDRR